VTLGNGVREAIYIIFVAGVLALLIVVLTSSGGHGSPSCMSKREARENWPRGHIYWHGPDHCWDNRRGRWHGRRHHRFRDPVMSEVRTVRNQVPTKQQVFDKHPTPKSGKIVGIDLDEWLANNCCWPDMPRDEQGNIIEPFAQRADAVPRGWWHSWWTYDNKK